ncbi:hypothetical protein [Desulfonatronospira sp.]|uniref:hypothetical protein n=1 Tax=Desulfonatronospira sp. TaxID=1962951 RepID=UPI0025BA8D89|nr:hypothetical protein [Desulfonatronospira sp.]
MRKICLLILLHVLVLGGIWLWRQDEQPPLQSGEPSRITVTAQDMPKITGGEMLLPGRSPVQVDIAGPARLALWIYMSENMLQDLSLEGDMSIRLDSNGQNILTGRVAGVDTSAIIRSGKTYYRVLLEMDPGQGSRMQVKMPDIKKTEETR